MIQNLISRIRQFLRIAELDFYKRQLTIEPKPYAIPAAELARIRHIYKAGDKFEDSDRGIFIARYDTHVVIGSLDYKLKLIEIDLSRNILYTPIIKRWAFLLRNLKLPGKLKRIRYVPRTDNWLNKDRFTYLSMLIKKNPLLIKLRG